MRLCDDIFLHCKVNPLPSSKLSLMLPPNMDRIDVVKHKVKWYATRQSKIDECIDKYNRN